MRRMAEGMIAAKIGLAQFRLHTLHPPNHVYPFEKEK
jgi:hypothetical protein